MPRALIPKRSFGVGEMDANFHLRRDTTQYQDGAEKFRNARPINSGAWTRRPGSYWYQDLAGVSRLAGFFFNNTQKYVLAFSDARMDAYLNDGTTAGSVTGAPWTQAQLNEMRLTVQGDTIFITHRDFKTQVMRRTGAASWSLSDYTFDSIFGDTIAQPYYKFDPNDVTLQPGAVTGTGISVTTSEDVFVASHVGTRFRYYGREIEITAVTDGKNATGDVIEKLPVTQQLSVSSTDAFSVGNIVESDSNAVKGEVVGIGSGTIDVVPNEGVDQLSSSGTLVGPEGSTTISASTDISPAATTNYDEQVFSDVRGYPGVCRIHGNRLVFMDHKTIPDAYMATRIGQFFNHDLGTSNDADAIFEFIGDGSVNRVRDMVSAENFMIFTDNGIYYVPERAGTPVKSDNISFRSFTSAQAGIAPAGRFASGILATDESGKRINRVLPTGNLEQPWEIVDISILSPHLIRNPENAAYAERFEDKPERYAFYVNDDGTMAVFHNIEDQNVNGFGLWETQGKYKSVCVVGEDVFVSVEREIDGNTIYTLEKLDSGLRLDAVKTFSGTSATVADYANQTIRVTGNDYDFGNYTPDGSGNFTVETESYNGDFEAGLFYTPKVKTLPIATPNAVLAAQIKRFTKIHVHINESGRYLVNNVAKESYRGGDDLTDAPPLRSEIDRFSTLGRSFEPPIEITQTEAVPLTVLGLSLEVSY